MSTYQISHKAILGDQTGDGKGYLTLTMDYNGDSITVSKCKFEMVGFSYGSVSDTWPIVIELLISPTSSLSKFSSVSSNSTFSQAYKIDGYGAETGPYISDTLPTPTYTPSTCSAASWRGILNTLELNPVSSADNALIGNKIINLISTHGFQDAIYNHDSTTIRLKSEYTSSSTLYLYTNIYRRINVSQSINNMPEGLRSTILNHGTNCNAWSGWYSLSSANPDVPGYWDLSYIWRFNESKVWNRERSIYIKKSGGWTTI